MSNAQEYGEMKLNEQQRTMAAAIPQVSHLAAALHQVAQLPHDVPREASENEPKFETGFQVGEALTENEVAPSAATQSLKEQILSILRSGQAVRIKAHDGYPERVLVMKEDGRIHELIKEGVMHRKTLIPHQGKKEMARRLKQQQRLQEKQK